MGDFTDKADADRLRDRLRMEGYDDAWTASVQISGALTCLTCQGQIQSGPNHRRECRKMAACNGSFAPLNPGRRILMGPGPSDMHPRVYQAMGAPLTGHLDPYFIQVMDDTKSLLRYVFQTENEMTFPISATGSAGMETCISNLVEPGDEVLVCVGGVFGDRMAQMVERHGGRLVRLAGEPGRPFTPEQVKRALDGCRPRLVGMVHAETSTGVLQPLEEITRIVHEHDALMLVDTVASLGGTPVKVDEWGIDICYTGSQKCLSAPPGLSPVTLNDRACAAIAARKTPVDSWYLDLSLINTYWNGDRVYHHTAPVNLIYALREAPCPHPRRGACERSCATCPQLRGV